MFFEFFDVAKLAINHPQEDLAIGKYESKKNSRILLHFGYLLGPVVEFWQFRIYLFSLKTDELGPFSFKKLLCMPQNHMFSNFLNFNPQKIMVMNFLRI